MTDGETNLHNFGHQGTTVSAGQHIAGLVEQPDLGVLTN